MSHSTDVRGSTVQVPRELCERLEAWACRHYPKESCGLLLGRRERQRTEVVDACEARNLDEERSDVYELDPADHLAAEEAARRNGLDVVGIWHSHPDHPARPSETDRLHAWEEWSYLIVAVDARGAWEMRAWRLERQRFVEEEIVP